MGMVVIQPYILVPKLKNKTKFLCCTGYPNSIKTYKARLLLIANSSSCTTTEVSKGPRTILMKDCP